MAVTYKNTWKNILIALMGKIRSEMKCPVYDHNSIKTKSNQFIKVIPTGSTLVDVASHMEIREYNIQIEYYFLKRNNNQFQNYVLNQVSILEALVHDNLTLTLADDSELINMTLDECLLDQETEEELADYYLAQWSLSGTHFGNKI